MVKMGWPYRTTRNPDPWGIYNWLLYGLSTDNPAKPGDDFQSGGPAFLAAFSADIWVAIKTATG